MANRDKKLSSLIILGGALLAFLFTPLIAEGLVFDAAKTTLSQLAEATGPLISIVLFSAIFVIGGLMLLWISTTLLDWAIEITPEALSILSGEGASVIQTGWNFTSGIVNMLLLILFIIIAISIILGTDSYGLKKSLPRLIMVAFLVNFTLLFVAMGVDISNFLFNSIANQMDTDTGTMIRDAMMPLLELGQGIYYWATSFVAGLAVRLGIPYVGTVIQITWLALFPDFIAQMTKFFVMGIIMYMMSVLLLLFFLVLLMRIFIIQILAILSPIAFFCLILPGTKKWWDEWVKHLVEWLLYGVAFIFLIYLGLAFAPVVLNLSQPFTDQLPWWLDWFGATSEILPYIVLLVYFLTIFFLCRKFVPSLANVAIQQGKAAFQMVSPVVGAWAKGSGMKFDKDIRDYLRKPSGTGKEGETRQDEWSKELEAGTGGVLDKKVKSSLVKRAERAEKAEKEKVKEHQEEIKDMTDEEKRSYIENAKKMQRLDPEAKRRYVAATTDYNDTVDKELTSKEAFERHREDAKKMGVEKDFLKANFIRYFQHTEKSQKEMIEEIRKLGKTKEDQQKMAKAFDKSYNSSDPRYSQTGEEAHKALLQIKDTNMIKGILNEAKDDNGWKNLEKVLDRHLEKQGKVINAQTRGEALKELSPTFEKNLAKNIGSAILDVEFSSQRDANRRSSRGRGSGESGDDTDFNQPSGTGGS